MKDLDYGAIKDAANKYSKDMTAFLRAMISHPSESSEEGEVVACIKAEMEKLGFDEVKVDGLGNVMGFMGTGDKIIAIDGHIDTVGILILMRALRTISSLVVVVALTRKAASAQAYMLQRL